MKKEFAVSVDITMSKIIYVEAESEDKAREIAMAKVYDDPHEIARSADAYVDHCIVDCYETGR